MKQDIDYIRSTKNLLDGYLNNLSFLFFAKSKFLGLGILLLLTLKPFMVLASVISFFTCLGIAKYIGVVPSLRLMASHSEHSNEASFYAYNSLLVSLLIASQYQITGISLLYLTLMSGATYVLSLGLSMALRNLFNLPLLNLSFAMMAIVVQLASRTYSNLTLVEANYYHNIFQIDLPQFFDAFFTSLGALIFLPFSWVGIVLFAFLLYYSRIYSLISLMSFGVGVLMLWLLKGSYPQALSNPFVFNFILIGWALGGFFVIPSRFSYSLILMAVAISVPVLDAVSGFWITLGIPVYTLPFLASTYVVFYVLLNLKHPKLTQYFLGNPEQNLNYHEITHQRFPVNMPSIQLPFIGKWNVYQGFHGKWTHQGIWAQALDFVIADADGKTFQNSGDLLTDYYAYSKPILSPVSGTVYALYDGFVDNVISEVDKENNWGNYIILRVANAYGVYFVEISHLQQSSLQVQIGEYVVEGQHLANCGNSGYSPEPHIHMQVQSLGHLGSATIDFRLNLFYQNKSFHFHKLGSEIQVGDVLSPIMESKKQAKIWQFILDTEYHFEVHKDGKLLQQIGIQVVLSPLGEYYLTDVNDSNADRPKIFFHKLKGQFYFHRYEGNVNSVLTQLYLAMPRIPLSDQACQWEENVDAISLIQSKRILGVFAGVLQSMFPKLIASHGFYHKPSNSNTLKSRIETRLFFSTTTHSSILKWDAMGVESITFKTGPAKFEWTRIENPHAEN